MGDSLARPIEVPFTINISFIGASYDSLCKTDDTGPGSINADHKTPTKAGSKMHGLHFVYLS